MFEKHNMFDYKHIMFVIKKIENYHNLINIICKFNYILQITNNIINYVRRRTKIQGSMERLS